MLFRSHNLGHLPMSSKLMHAITFHIYFYRFTWLYDVVVWRWSQTHSPYPSLPHQDAGDDNFMLLRRSQQQHDQNPPPHLPPPLSCEGGETGGGPHYEPPQPHPLPMPEYGGYFAPLTEYLPDSSQPITAFHRSVLHQLHLAANFQMQSSFGFVW